MASYMVMEPPLRDRAEKAVLIRDGFHVVAFLVPFIWFAFHRMWREAAFALGVGVVLSIAGSFAGLGAAGGWLTLLIGIYFGLEGAALRVAALKRVDWIEWGVVEAHNARDAEIRYLNERDVEAEPEAPRVIAPGSRTSPRARHSGPALGLLDYPGLR